jgi:hypothetical protein
MLQSFQSQNYILAVETKMVWRFERLLGNHPVYRSARSGGQLHNEFRPFTFLRVDFQLADASLGNDAVAEKSRTGSFSMCGETSLKMHSLQVAEHSSRALNLLLWRDCFTGKGLVIRKISYKQ